MTALGTVIGRGAHASRPAAGIAGSLYYETDTFTLFRDSGSAWENVEAAAAVSPLTTKGDLFAHSTLDARLPVGSNGQVLTADSAQTLGVKWAAAAGGGGIGGSSLIYRYTVAGADKLSIDTGVDTPDAGSNDWTNGDLLEIFMSGRTDEVGIQSNIDVTFNNDTSAVYDRQYQQTNLTTVTAGNAVSGSNWPLVLRGTTGAANEAASTIIRLPGYAGTTFVKTGDCTTAVTDSTSGNLVLLKYALGYRSTSAITRLKVICDTSGKKLKVGTQLLIYKRLAS
jgi:hypothetical protein